MRRLGDERLIHHEAKWKCESCGAEFDNECCLCGHISGKWCRKREDMTGAQQMQLRQTRKTSQARRGQVPCKAEPINVFTCDGSRTKPCGEFVYLGTQIDPTCSATPEIRRRCGISCAVFDSLSTLWRSSSIATDVKGAYIVHSSCQ